MSVFRVEKTRDFTIMSNYHLRDRSISLKAKGLLSVMLSLPEDWDYTMAGLAHISKEGIGSIKSAIDELEDAGYIVHGRIRNSKGQLKGTEYVIYEHPVGNDERRTVEPICKNQLLVSSPAEQPFVFDDDPVPEEPILENPTQAFPTQGEPVQDEPTQENPAQINNNLPITQKQNTYSAITHSINPPADGGRIDVDAERQKIREQIDYEYICTPTNRGQLDEFVEAMMEVALERSIEIRIGKHLYPTDYVQQRFRAITGEHIRYLLDSFDENTTFVHYSKAYVLTSLFNTTASMDNHYMMRVQHDLYGE